MAETKDNTLSVIALVALVAVVGMVVAFAVATKGNTQTATPVIVTTAPASSENSAGMMRWGGDDEGECKDTGIYCNYDQDCIGMGKCVSNKCCA